MEYDRILWLVEWTSDLLVWCKQGGGVWKLFGHAPKFPSNGWTQRFMVKQASIRTLGIDHCRLIFIELFYVRPFT